MFSKPLICTPIQARSQKEAFRQLKSLKGKADCAEIWLDHIHDLDLSGLFKKKPLPIVAVCKKPNEKGKFIGSDAELVALLKKAAKRGADYIDIPFAFFQKEKVSRKNFPARAKVILSHHDFGKTPSPDWMLQKARAMRRAGADIVKLAFMAHSFSDTFQIIMLAQALKDLKIPHVLIAMGQKGILSRVITPLLGGTLMFAPLVKQKSTAPGQLTVKELRKVWRLFV